MITNNTNKLNWMKIGLFAKILQATKNKTLGFVCSLKWWKTVALCKFLMNVTWNSVTKRSKNKVIYLIFFKALTKILEISLDTFLSNINIVFIHTKNRWWNNSFFNVSVWKKGNCITWTLFLRCVIKFISCKTKVFNILHFLELLEISLFLVWNNRFIYFFFLFSYNWTCIYSIISNTIKLKITISFKFRTNCVMVYTNLPFQLPKAFISVAVFVNEFVGTARN